MSKLENLTILGLAGNRIDDISALINLTQLKQLVIHKNQIKDIGILPNLKSLEELWLMENPINQNDIEWLKNELPSCKIGF